MSASSPGTVGSNADLTGPADQGQGGAQGIEDGVAMGIVMAGAQADQVQERLRVFEGLRRKRCSAMQIFSNAGQDEVERVRAEASEFMPVDEIPSKLSASCLHTAGRASARSPCAALTQPDRKPRAVCRLQLRLRHRTRRRRPHAKAGAGLCPAGRLFLSVATAS